MALPPCRPRRRGPPRDPGAGVTLLEALLALAVFGMIGVALAGLMGTGAQVWVRTGSLMDVAAEGAARARLRERLEAMPEVTPDGPLPELFAGNATEVRFMPTLAADASEPAWSVVGYDAEAGRLTYRNGLLVEGTPAETLISGIGEARIRFYGRRSVYDEPAWVEDWEDALLLPRLIRIETVRLDGTPNPPLTVWPARDAAQLAMSASSLVPPAWPSAS